MTEASQFAQLLPERAIETLGDGFYDMVEAARFPEHHLRYRNDRAAAESGLAGLSNNAWIDRFARFEPIAGSLEHPLALRYHGHQFRAYNPDIGDGRGFLYAQLRDRAGRLMDLGTKGSGQTPWSRFGDGRLTLKGGVREVLATEMLEALGVDTSRTLSLIETGEALHRGDEPSPTRSAVLVRLSHGHIRIGTFQRLAYLGDGEGLERLVEYTLINLLAPLPPAGGAGGGPSFSSNAEARPTPDPSRKREGGAISLLTHVVANTAHLAASYMAAGFVHGVLNSDNINVTGESFDYGPWRFAPTYDPGFTAAYFDQTGLYAFGRQAEAILWDAMQLALALRPLAEIDALQAALDGFVPAYRRQLATRFLWRLGVQPHDQGSDIALAAAIETALTESQVPLDRFWFDWRGGAVRGTTNSYGPPFDPIRAALADRDPASGALDHAYWSDAEPCAMLIDEVEALWAPIAAAEDWRPLHAKVEAVRRLGEAMGPAPLPK